MSELCLLCQKIALGFIGWCDLNGNSLGDRDTGVLKGLEFLRIIGHEANPIHSEMAEYIRAQCVVAMVGFKSQMMVGFDGVLSFILQLIGHEFVHQADPTALLQLIDKDAATGVSYSLVRHFQLGPTVASGGTENITCQTLGMDSDQRCFNLCGFFFHQNNGTIRFVFGFKSINPEIAEMCRKCGFGDFDCFHMAEV